MRGRVLSQTPTSNRRRAVQLITAHQVLYLEAEEQLGQRLDSLDKLQREGARESDAGSLPKALLVFTPVPGEMHKP